MDRGNKLLKTILCQFWYRFGDRRRHGRDYSTAYKLKALIELSQVQIPYKNQQPCEVRRAKFDEVKHKLHPWRRFGVCFVCGEPAQDRHHIIQLQNGGINSKKNLVSLCNACHGQIHPWMV